MHQIGSEFSVAGVGVDCCLRMLVDMTEHEGSDMLVLQLLKPFVLVRAPCEIFLVFRDISQGSGDSQKNKDAWIAGTKCQTTSKFLLGFRHWKVCDD